MKNITTILGSYLNASQQNWLQEAVQHLSGERGPELFSQYFSKVNQVCRREDVALSNSHLYTLQQELQTQLPFDLWDLRELLRLRLVVCLFAFEESQQQQAIQSCYRYADDTEQAALLKLLSLFPEAPCYVNLALEGYRSNSEVVFKAVTQYNPFPSEYFDENAFNNMVLKNIFIGLPLHPIWGLEQRMTSKLKHMVQDWVAERIAANRPIPPDVQRLSLKSLRD